MGQIEEKKYKISERWDSLVEMIEENAKRIPENELAERQKTFKEIVTKDYPNIVKEYKEGIALGNCPVVLSDKERLEFERILGRSLDEFLTRNWNEQALIIWLIRQNYVLLEEYAKQEAITNFIQTIVDTTIASQNSKENIKVKDKDIMSPYL